jgi:hypothetical protein
MKRMYSSIIRRIARQEGVSPEFVYAEMQKAISAGYDSPDPIIQKRWSNIAPDGTIPTPEKMIEMLSKRVTADK